MSGGVSAGIAVGQVGREKAARGTAGYGKTGKALAKNEKNAAQKSKKSFRETIRGVAGYFFGTQTHIITAEKKYSFPLSIIFISLSITIIIMLIITASVRINEITTENASLKATYNSLVSEEGELRLKLETRDDLRVVEDVAKNELGMVKRDQVPRYYLTVRSEDKIEIIEEKTKEEGGVFDKIASLGKSVAERILKFFGR